MSQLNTLVEERLAKVALPLKNIEPTSIVENEYFAKVGKEALSTKYAWSRVEGISGMTCSEQFHVGDLLVVSGKTTPMGVIDEKNNNFALQLCAYGAIEYIKDDIRTSAQEGSILVCPNNGGTFATTFYSGISLQLDGTRLRQAIAAVSGTQSEINLKQAFTTRVTEKDSIHRPSTALFQFFKYIDSLLLEDQSLPTVLNLDDQIYRGMALEYVIENGLLEEVKRRERLHNCRSSVLDDLVDWIRENGRLNITLTDLQNQSHYSSRQLQSMFRKKFDCTPMEFVKKQRLSKALERLECPDEGDSVTRIARDFGYRHVSNFSKDFQKEFRFSPSQVLRSSGPQVLRSAIS
jgi:AraC-like DNA-binding protein